MQYNTNELKAGVKIILDDAPCNILETEFHKPGKGQAVYRVKYRNLKTGRVLEKTFKTGESVLSADVTDMELQYLYTDGSFFYFMNTETFEQYSINAEILQDAQKWIKEQDICSVTFWNDTPISINPPIFVMLKVTYAEPGVKGDTATGGSKTVTLETGTSVRVPLFINEGDILKIDTRTGKYISKSSGN